ncbi:MAG: glycyl-radical enzyme activating protein [Clostridia bacterium]|nr:glycyl-radical enzyme activating protein [Clostridia bacterium]
MKEGTILNIQRMSTEDGPGLRTTVFFKGCTLQCRWCHNPESINFAKEHEWFEMKCIRCGTCIVSCSNKAISFVDDHISIDESLCEKCMECTVNCPTNALEAKGGTWTAQELYDELIKDKAYFGQQGGITLSGGEVLAQVDFAYELLIKLKESGVHTAVDTCGQVKFENIEKIAEAASLFLYDLKIFDSNLHKENTAHGSELIIENFEKLCRLQQEKQDFKIWVRTPLIPGITDTEENVRDIAEFISQNSAAVERWELLAFNNLCESKYDRLGRKWEFRNVKKQNAEKLEKIESILREYHKLNGKAFVTGGESKI